MVTGRPVFKLLALSFVLAFGLAACVRPLSQSDDAVSADATATAEAAAVDVAEEGAAADESATEEGAVEEGAPAEGGATDETSSEDTTDESSSEGESAAGESEEGGDEGETTEEGSAGAGEESSEGAADEAGNGDENVGGGTPDMPEEGAAEETTGDAEAGADEATTAEEAAPAEEAVQSPAPLPATHTVAAGENLYRIGLKYGMSWVVLAQYNNIPNADRIYVGQVLQIPGGQPPPSQPPPQAPEYTSYVVKPGDNLYRIGLAFGVSWVDIAAANGIVNPNFIYAGQVLKIPTNSPGQPPQLTHTVHQGETLFRISLRYGVSWVAIAQANHISSPYVIYPGQTLIIPSG